MIATCGLVSLIFEWLLKQQNDRCRKTIGRRRSIDSSDAISRLGGGVTGEKIKSSVPFCARAMWLMLSLGSACFGEATILSLSLIPIAGPSAHLAGS